MSPNKVEGWRTLTLVNLFLESLTIMITYASILKIRENYLGIKLQQIIFLFVC